MHTYYVIESFGILGFVTYGMTANVDEAKQIRDAHSGSEICVDGFWKRLEE